MVEKKGDGAFMADRIYTEMFTKDHFALGATCGVKYRTSRVASALRYYSDLASSHDLAADDGLKSIMISPRITCISFDLSQGPTRS